MTCLSRICLGSAQFGAAYGISNRWGRPQERDIQVVLEYAAESGIGYIDTAPSYGDAEVLIGKYLPRNRNLRIVTKVSPVADSRINISHANSAIAAIENSLRRMRLDCAYAVLVHHASDMSKPGAEWLVAALIKAQERGLVENIGASVYDSAQISEVRRRVRVDLIQLPLNVLDRRLETGGDIEKLKADGIEVHARSVFLQGLLLMEPNDLPEYFAPLRETLARLHDAWRGQGVSPLCACLAFALRRDGVDAVVVGVNRLSELCEIHRAVVNLHDIAPETGPDFRVAPMFLNPACWPSFAD